MILTRTIYTKIIVLSKELEILSLNKLSSKEIYSILIPKTVNKPTSNIYFEKLFANTTLDWSKIYLSPSLATIDTTLTFFNIKFIIKYFFSIKNYTLLE